MEITEAEEKKAFINPTLTVKKKSVRSMLNTVRRL